MSVIFTQAAAIRESLADYLLITTRRAHHVSFRRSLHRGHLVSLAPKHEQCPEDFHKMSNYFSFAGH